MSRKPRNSRFIRLVAAAWAVSIFATSCTFIERSIFINFVKKFIPTGVPQHLWVSFWGAFGIFVVKAYHVAEFALLCYLLFSVLNVHLLKKPGKATLMAAAVAAIYAASDEWHQTFVPGRGGTWVDVVIDCCGIGFACAVIQWQLKRRKQIQTNE